MVPSSFFYDIVFAAVNDHVPMVELRQKFPPWFTRTVRDLLREKEQAHKRKKLTPLLLTLNDTLESGQSLKGRLTTATAITCWDLSGSLERIRNGTGHLSRL